MTEDTNIRDTIPMDGDLFGTSMFLNAMSGNNRVYWVRYLTHLQYQTGLYKFTGDEQIEKLSAHIMRQVVEFGKVALTKVNGRYAALAVVHVENDIYKQVKKAKLITMRDGTGYTKDQKQFELNGANVAILKNNYYGLPFIFYWDDVIVNMIKLSQAAITGSISAVKKFKRSISNNDSDINQIETESMMDPTHPYINNIVNPPSYKNEIQQAKYGSVTAGTEISTGVITPNETEFENSSGAETLWDNLKEFTNFEYYQRGRRINTNKKNERNLEGEIDAEAINFEIMEREFQHNLDIFVSEVNEKFGLNIEYVKVSDEMEIEKGKAIKAENGDANGTIQKV